MKPDKPDPAERLLVAALIAMTTLLILLNLTAVFGLPDWFSRDPWR